MKIYLDAGTTWSKIISNEKIEELQEYFFKTCHCEKQSDVAIQKNKNYNNHGLLHPQGVRNDKYYYILPSSKLKNYNFKFEKTTGHMTGVEKPENEIISLVKGVEDKIDKNALVLDLGSRDAKWIKLKDGKFFGHNTDASGFGWALAGGLPEGHGGGHGMDEIVSVKALMQCAVIYAAAIAALDALV